MKTFESDKQRLLDLLVDGELNEAQRREVLSWCEREPDGWRRCALAFLDAQSWRGVLGQITGERPAAVSRQIGDPQRSDDPLCAAPRAGAAVVERPKAAPPRSWFTPALALAASVLVAFALGLWARGGWPAGDRNMLPLDERHALSRVANDGDSPSDALAAGRPEQGPTGKVRLVVGGPAGAADEIQLPVVEAQSLGDDWLDGQPAMPLDVQQALERLGHRVRQKRQLVPFSLDDGRRVMVPVDQIEVQPTIERAYQ